MFLLLLACAPSSILLGEDTFDGPSEADADTDADTDTDTDADTDRPCAFVDNWIPEMQLPNMTLYRYELTGCGVVNGCSCDDPDVANAGLTAAAFLDGSQGAVELVINVWIPGATTCQCTVADLDYWEDYSASYVVSVESSE